MVALKNKMKPVDKKVVCYPFVGDTIGGSHLSTLTLIDNLKKREDKTQIKPLIVLHHEGKFSNYLKARNIDYIMLPLGTFVGRHSAIFKKIFSFVCTLPKVSFFLLRHKVSIVHTNDARMHLTWSLPSKLLDKKHVWHQRTLWCQGRLPELLINFAKEVICISTFVKSSLPCRKNKEVSVLWNPVRISADETAIDNFRYSVLSNYPNDWKGYMVSTVGNLQAIKQPLLFIQMGLQMLKLSSKNIHFVIVGEDRGDYISEMKKLVDEASCSKQFSFLGFREDIAEIISASDLVVACSKADAFGRTIIESMSLNTPVVAIDAGGHSEIIQNKQNGFLFDNDKPDDMAKCSLDILTNTKDTSAVVESARNFANIYFDDELHADKIIDIYRKAID